MKFILTILIFFLLTPLLTSAQEDYQGELVSADDSSAVYYISKDSQKYSFLNEKIYISWFDNFKYVKNVSTEKINEYEYGGAIKLRPQIYENLDYILPEKTLVKQINSPGYFYIENGQKRVFTTIEIFENNGFKIENAITADISEYPWGQTINSVENILLNSSQFIEPITKAHDFDQDGLSDYDEKYIYYSNLNNPDTDNDGIIDGEEIKNNNSPNHAHKKLIAVDSDQDYLNDAWEIIIGTDLMNPDSDGDLYLDGTEVAASYNPLDANSGTKSEKLIKVNLAKQHLEYYFDDKLMDSFPISSGIQEMDTPKGEFEILGKEDVKRYGGPGYDFDYPDTKWNLHFYTGQYRFYIHGAYWHNNFGHKMSHGCVNVSYDNMEPLYWFANIGTKVVIE